MDDRDDSLAADLGLNYGDYMLKANGTLKSGLSDILLDVSGRWPTGYSTKTLASSLELKDRSKVAFHTVSFMEIISFEEAEFGILFYSNSASSNGRQTCQAQIPEFKALVDDEGVAVVIQFLGRMGECMNVNCCLVPALGEMFWHSCILLV